MKLDETAGSEPTFLVRFFGVRGSHPVPGPDAVHFGGNTSCIEVESGAFRLVFDCGTGLVPLGNRLAQAGGGARALVLVSHLHHDHTMGFPFFKPVYDKSAHLTFAGPSHQGRSFQELFESAFADPYFPVAPGSMPSHRTYLTLENDDGIAWHDPGEPPRHGRAEDAGTGVFVRAFRNLNHPNGGVLNFRVERGGRSIVLATDVEGTSGPTGDLVELARGADLLIHDAQYTDEEYELFTQGWGHSTWRMATDVAWRAQVRRLVLYHHDPSHDDEAVEEIERLARGKFSRCISACEGMEILI
jgi:phosphoribosyl 1,2-cyclic phosphodiesterase